MPVDLHEEGFLTVVFVDSKNRMTRPQLRAES
jgi:hypothetical protein